MGKPDGSHWEMRMMCKFDKTNLNGELVINVDQAVLPSTVLGIVLCIDILSKYPTENI